MLLAGIDVVQRQGFEPLKGKRVGLLSNGGTIDRAYRYTADVFRQAHAEGVLTLAALFGPQHGMWGHTQDNMVEWEGDGEAPIPVHSLYGKHREPTDAMLEGLDVLVVDIPDVGARYYTFIWTMALCLKACARKGIPVLVLDRPNPIGGVQVEGPVLHPHYTSFVGLYPLPTRHGMTSGEVARRLVEDHFGACELAVLPVEGWDRAAYLDETDYPWAMPSPNMPTVHTAAVYPGMCLVEATNLSEGRGTTRPFETFGAPWLDGWRLAASLNQRGLPGVVFRPVEFQPTFQKHGGQVCQGCFLHVVDRRTFEPVLAAVVALQEAWRQNPTKFGWGDPPYEYVWDKRPIDILAGNGWLRAAIELGTSTKEVRERFQSEVEAWRA